MKPLDQSKLVKLIGGKELDDIDDVPVVTSGVIS